MTKSRVSVVIPTRDNLSDLPKALSPAYRRNGSMLLKSSSPMTARAMARLNFSMQ